jgi:hypothetical protein
MDDNEKTKDPDLRSKDPENPETTSQPNLLLSPFLRMLADRIDSETITESELQHIGEFYMSHLFREQVVKDNSEDTAEEFTEKDFKKFLTLGWYVYTQIATDKNL